MVVIGDTPMPGLLDIAALAKSIKELSETIGIRVTKTAVPFLLVFSGVGYNLYDTNSLSGSVSDISAKISSLESRQLEAASRYETLNKSFESRVSEFNKLTDRLEDIQDGYWIPATIFSSNSKSEYSLATLPISRSDDAFLQLFVPDDAQLDSISNVKLMLNGIDLPIKPYMANFPTPLPKEAMSDGGSYQQFKLIFGKSDPATVASFNKVWMLVVIKRHIVIKPPKDDQLASYRD
jgi:hypothetical protein